MDDYIKRGDIAKLAIEEKRFVFQMEDLLKEEIVVKTVYKDFFDFIKSIPAADVAPVRHCGWALVEQERNHDDWARLRLSLGSRGHRKHPRRRIWRFHPRQPGTLEGG